MWNKNFFLFSVLSILIIICLMIIKLQRLSVLEIVLFVSLITCIIYSVLIYNKKQLEHKLEMDELLDEINETIERSKLVQSENKKFKENYEELTHFEQKFLEKLNKTLYSNEYVSNNIPLLNSMLQSVIDRTNSESEMVISKLNLLSNKANFSANSTLSTIDEWFHNNNGSSFISILNKSEVHLDEINDTFSKLMDSNVIIESQLKNIEGKIDDIKSFTRTVEDISEHSNVLSVNASIEAAKSGTIGTGFSVVAKEIQKLALHTKQSVSTIASVSTEAYDAVKILKNEYEGIIENLSSQIVNCKKSLESFIELTKHISGQMEGRLNDLADNSGEIKKHMNDVFMTLQSQDAVSQQISHIQKILLKLKGKSNSIYNHFEISEPPIDVHEIIRKVIKDIYLELTMEYERETLKTIIHDLKIDFDFSNDVNDNSQQKVVNRSKEIIGEDFADSIVLF